MNDGSYIMDPNADVWEENRNVYGKHTSSAALPVDLTVSYQLDGSPIDPAALAGKSGRVTIRFDYANNRYEMVDIDGKQEKMYVPFAMLTGMVLDNEKFTNVTVSNGKVLNDGQHTVVIGMALPGLQENLALDTEDFEVPDYVEIRTDGLKEFNEEGIQKFTDLLDGDLDGLLTRLRATVDVLRDYTAFDGADDGLDGEVKFICKTDAIQVPEG